MRLPAIVAVLFMPGLVFGQNSSDDVGAKRPVPGTLTPEQQVLIEKALPPLDPPELRPPAPPRIASQETEKKKEESPLEWTANVMGEIEKLAIKVYQEDKSFVGLTNSLLQDEIESLEAPWGGEVRVMRAVSEGFTIRLPNVPPQICGEIYNTFNYKNGIRFINLCSAVKRTPLMYSYSNALYDQEQAQKKSDKGQGSDD